MKVAVMIVIKAILTGIIIPTNKVTSKSRFPLPFVGVGVGVMGLVEEDDDEFVTGKEGRDKEYELEPVVKI